MNQAKRPTPPAQPPPPAASLPHLSSAALADVVRELRSLQREAAQRAVQLAELREENRVLRQSVEHAAWLRGA